MTRSFYLATSRELKRLDATTKSPIFASFSELLAGVSTVRAFGQGPRFIAENEAKVDRNQAAYHASINTNRWLAVRLEFIVRLSRCGRSNDRSGLGHHLLCRDVGGRERRVWQD